MLELLMMECCSYYCCAKVITKLSDYSTINAQTNDGNTALHYAVQNGHLKTVKCLLTPLSGFIKEECDVTIANNDEKTALDLAKENGNPEIIALLEDAQKAASP
ncbi:MAG: hypothetical protein PG981_001105 [Wolbachia endosymbiont of Ctenocephalides orientis wCori]|nr:MAG: hypothetical protein PG981_001105 [Wolbachia endosymbiont of Ctenocephalides orientis wCori]